MHGARVIALRGNFDEALELVRELVAAPSDRARQLGQPVPARGAEDRGVRDRRGARRARRAVHPRRQRRQHHRLLEGLPGAGPRAADARLPGRGRGAARARRARREPRDRRQRDPDRQPGPLGGGDGGDAPTRAARSRPSATRRSSTPTGCWPRARASSASRPAPRRSPGCSSTAAGRRAARRLRAHRPRAEGPPDRARAGGLGRALRRPSSARSSSAIARVRRAAPPPRPRPGLARRTSGRASTRSPRRWRCTWSSRWSRRGRFAVETDLAIARDRRNLAVRGFERLPPGRRLHVPHPLRHPALPAASGRAPRPTSAGLMAADHLFELDADLLALATRARGPSRQRRRGAARRLRRSAPTARRPASTRRPGSRPCSSCRTSRCARSRPGRRCRPRSPIGDAVFNVAHASLLVARARPRRLGPRRPRPRRPPAPAPPRAPLPALDGARPRARPSSARSGATISGAGPTVLVWCHFEQTGARVEALRREAEGWARRRCARRSSRTGADVRELQGASGGLRAA